MIKYYFFQCLMIFKGFRPLVLVLGIVGKNWLKCHLGGIMKVLCWEKPI